MKMRRNEVILMFTLMVIAYFVEFPPKLPQKKTNPVVVEAEDDAVSPGDMVMIYYNGFMGVDEFSYEFTKPGYDVEKINFSAYDND